MRRVVVTGLGAVSPLGVGVRQTWTRLVAGHSGITSTAHLGDSFASLPSRVAGLIPTTGPASWNSAVHARKGEDPGMPLFTRYALAATHEALVSSHLLPASTDCSSPSLSLALGASSDPENHKIGVSLGSGIGDLSTAYSTSLAFDSRGHHAVHPLFVPRLLLNLAAGHIALRYGLRGPNLCPTSACTTGAHALADAYHRLAHPRSPTDIFIAGASEACIHPLAMSGFARARALATAFNDTPSQASRPFDAQRAGFVIAEGAAMLVLEELSSALRRGAPILAELVGVGESCDAYHVTAPPPAGTGAAQAMRDALAMAGVRPDRGEAPDYVNAHATSTKVGDEAENHALRAVLLGPASGVKACDVAVSSTKGATGHLLGAAGSFEALVTVLAVKEGVVPPTVNLERLSPGEDGLADWPFDYVGLDGSGARRKDVRLALTNSFGFGGTNASLCFRRFEA